MSESRNLAVKYTDEIYVTYTQLGRILGLSNYDDFWTPIQKYREEYKVVLPFGKIHGNNYFITLTEPIKVKIIDLERKARDFCLLSRNLSLEQPKESKRILLAPILKDAAILEKSSINDLSIEMLLKSLYRENDQSHAPIVNYLSALNYYLLGSPLSPDDDFLGGAYQKVLGQEELMDFYRQNDFDAKIKYLAYVRNPEYPYAPCGMLYDLMDNLLNWLKDDQECPSFVHAFTAQLFLDYIKPFNEKNGLMASLLAKDCIAYSMSIQEAFVLPFEAFLKTDFTNSDAYRESKAKCDLTYAILEAIERMSTYIDETAKQLNVLRVNKYKAEYSTLSEEEEKVAKAQEAQITPTQLSLELNEENSEENENASEDTAIQEQVEEEHIEEEPKEKTQVLIKENPQPQTKKIESIDISHSSQETLSKSEVKDYTRYLLETNPNLNKKQAAFLANHCTQGRYYTIQQFKEFAHCVYETARTSMDKIASEGYYEKRQFKNKFVYTPVKKG